MPWLTRLRLDNGFGAVLTHYTNAAAGHAQYQCRNVTAEQQVTAAPHDQQRHVVLGRIGKSLSNIIVAVRLGKEFCLNINAKGVEGLERNG